MSTQKKFFTYKNKIILTNGSTLKIKSIKYINNFQLTFNLFNSINNIKEPQNKLTFIQKIFH